jgi:hypothetical protein
MLSLSTMALRLLDRERLRAAESSGSIGAALRQRLLVDRFFVVFLVAAALRFAARAARALARFWASLARVSGESFRFFLAGAFLIAAFFVCFLPARFLTAPRFPTFAAGARPTARAT